MEASAMRISWFFGFGWLSVLTVFACGVGINLLSGPVTWVLYVPFLVVAVYMTVRFRLFNAQPWRRVHSKAMIAYGKFAEQEYETAKNENREFDIAVPCRRLAEHLFAQRGTEESGLLLDEKRKMYYKELVGSYPHVFLTGVKPERHDEVIKGVKHDIDGSKLGPDILIARAIELQHHRREAANYLQALLLGNVR